MQTKQFSGATIDDVLGQVRAEFGDDAVILETRNVVRGGIAGFFGKAGIEVTASDRMPSAGVDLHDDAPSAGRAAAATVPAPAPDGESFLTSLGLHLGGETAAAPSAGATLAGPTATPTAADHERARAIIEAARAAVREAAADPTDAPPAPAVDSALAADAAEVPQEPARPSVDRGSVGRLRSAGADEEAPVDHDDAVGPPVDPALIALRSELLAAGTDQRRLDALLDGYTRAVAPFLAPDADRRAALRDYLAARLPVVRDWRPWRGGHTITLVGQSGVGKSATALKLAGRFRAAGLSVAVVAAGGGVRGALGDRGRELGLTVVEATDAAAVAAACRSFADRDLVVVDTPGCSYLAATELERLAALTEAAAGDETHLVLPAATPIGDLGDLQQAFRPLGVNRVTLTKLDETRYYGGLLNAPMRIGRPLAYIADGADLPGAITPADPRLVAELLLP